MINNAKDYIRYISKPSFVSQKIFSKNFLAIHEIKPVLTLNKAIYVRFSILDLSKMLMYKFHYKYIKRKYDANLLFADTDNLVYEIKIEDVYEDFYKEQIIGEMNDEPKGKIISEFVGLKSKKYSLIVVDDEEVKKAKGVNKNVKKIRHKEYIDVFFYKK